MKIYSLSSSLNNLLVVKNMLEIPKKKKPGSINVCPSVCAFLYLCLGFHC